MVSFWRIFIVYHCYGQIAATSTKPVSSVLDHSVCPSRTANYLTHTLAQQCLTSSRNITPVQTTGSNATQSTSITSHGAIITPSNYTTSSSPIVGQSDSSTLSDRTDSTGLSISMTTVTATAVSNQALVPALPEVIEEESPLESGNFLSFEEWKKQNLQKVGQSEHVGRDANTESREVRKRPTNVHNSLDSLGEEGEIDLDFGGFVPDGPETPGRKTRSDDDMVKDGNTQYRSQRKDAGTTCKERFNYASFDCAANLLKTNPQVKSPGAILNENKDAYMLNECSADNKFTIIELCNDILVDTIVLANFEFFSSIFRLFRVSVSDRYPVKMDKWRTLGTFEARNSREVQAFLVQDPVIWARYLRIEFLTHYGTEFYCPVSLLRVHGTTMLEEYKHDMDASREDDEDHDVTESSELHGEKLVPEAIDDKLASKAQEDALKDKSTTMAETTEAAAARGSEQLTKAEASVEPHKNMSLSLLLGFESFLPSPHELDICLDSEKPQLDQNLNKDENPTQKNLGADAKPERLAVIDAPATNMTAAEQVGILTDQTNNHTIQTESLESNRTIPSSSSASSMGSDKQNPSAANSSSHATSTDRSKSTALSSSEKPKHAGSSTQSPPPSPTMQESFFKSVQKRLQMLESNSSLSLQYIEEQSRALRDAFRKVEQRQLAKTTIFLEHLNSTVSKELREFRQQYDQLWQSTVIELELQRELYQRENQAMHARLGVLADELIFQKRMSILQMTLILVCLGLVLFTRGAINNYLELPLVQSVLSRSPSRRWMNLSGDDSAGHQLTRARSAHQIRSPPNSILKEHRRMQSEESNLTDNFSQSEIFSPPTPASFDGFSDASQPLQDDNKLGSNPEFDPITIERPSTSPPSLISNSASNTPRRNGDHKGVSINSRLMTPGSSNDSLILPSMQSNSVPSTPPQKSLKWDLPDS